MSAGKATDRKLDRYARLLEVGQIITSEMNLEALFPLIIEHTNAIMEAEASSIFLFDEKTDELWTLVSTNLGKNEIRIPSTYGIAGWVFQHRSSAIVNDTSGDPRFHGDVDTKTGFRTRNILCVPLVNRQKVCIGTLQTLNKRGSDFSDGDVEMLTSLGDYATIALENSRLYEDLKAMNKAKERAISHLSHELKTPLALISATMGAISSKTAEAGIKGLERSLTIARKNLQRLLKLQEEIDQILGGRSVEDRVRIANLVEDALHFVAHEIDASWDARRQVLEALSHLLESIYRVDAEEPERLPVANFLRAICDEAREAMGGRAVDIAEDFEKGLVVTTCRSALARVCQGILRNAVENTPDEGRVEVTAAMAGERLEIRFRDFGIGITPENQKLIFSGFFHTQDTDYYSTKTPYDFNAGGSGADLLRSRVFSERYGFSIDFDSTRCAFIPADTDECPGQISRCSFIDDVSGCRASGTTFSLTIPIEKTAEETF